MSQDELNVSRKSSLAKYRLTNKEKCAMATEKHKIKVRLEVLNHYGAVCACCGELRYEFLTIDHVNNDGAKHRRETKMGAGICYWLKKNNYPDGFQVLCMNCNWAKSRYGGCPHKRENMQDAGLFCETPSWQEVSRGCVA
jgi:hypothetical protein